MNRIFASPVDSSEVMKTRGEEYAAPRCLRAIIVLIVSGILTLKCRWSPKIHDAAPASCTWVHGIVLLPIKAKQVH
jgi:hypothetical protein